MIKPVTAVIAVAGFGTRMLPVTKAISKEMLPVGSRPIVDYVVENAVNAGVQRIIFITREDDEQLRKFYSKPDKELVKNLRSAKKNDILKELEHLHTQVTYEFINQPHDGRYGTGVLPIVVEQALAGEDHFWLLAGDNAAYRRDGLELKDMLDEINHCGYESGIAGFEVPRHEVSRYGVMDIEEQSGVKVLKGFAEKPAVEDAPSNIINISNYLFHSDLIDLCKELKPQKSNGELYITDAFEDYTKKHPMLVWSIVGDFIDVGSVEKFIAAQHKVQTLL